jgi:hypothetical protein
MASHPVEVRPGSGGNSLLGEPEAKAWYQKPAVIIGIIAAIVIVAGGIVAWVLLAGGSTGGSEAPVLGGVYSNSNFKASAMNFAGLRSVSDGKVLTFVGSDDGKVFWNVHGKWTDKSKGEFIAFFSHRGDGHHDTTGKLSKDGISWNSTEDKAWKPMTKPSFSLKQEPFAEPTLIGGLFVDPALFTNGSFKGTRMIGADYFPNISIVGTDDGETFWFSKALWDGPNGQFIATMDGKNSSGIIESNSIKWQSGALKGSAWLKETVGGEWKSPSVVV